MYTELRGIKTAVFLRIQEGEMMLEVYRAALDKAGYESDPTDQNVREMFRDYVDCGYFADIDPDEINF